MLNGLPVLDATIAVASLGLTEISARLFSARCRPGTVINEGPALRVVPRRPDEPGGFPLIDLQSILCIIISAMSANLPRRDIANVDELKALAHPLRQRMLYHLAFAGSSTATSVAQALGEDTGSASYHLRQLERFGFIENDPNRPSRRERWWRLVPLDLRSVKDPAAATVEAGRLGRIRLERDRRLVDRYLRNRHGLPAAEGAVFSSSATHLTTDELSRFTEEYVALLAKWWRSEAERPVGAVPVAVLFYAFPWPGEQRRGG